jgi:hypothetical protein
MTMSAHVLRRFRRPSFQGTWLATQRKEPVAAQQDPAKAQSKIINFPARPDSGVLSSSIPLFFIARNRVGLWIVREAEGSAGGIFLFKQSALRFADKYGAPGGCATMILTERAELDVDNRGNRLAERIGAAVNAVRRYIPAHPPPIPIMEKKRKAEWE